MIRLLFVVCVAFTGVTSMGNLTFDKPRYAVSPSELPNIFHNRLSETDLQRYPLAIEAVLSVALKLQEIEDRGGKQQNFIVSPLAVAGALGQLMLGARGELRKQIAVLLTLHDTTTNRVTNNAATFVQQRFGDNSAATTEQNTPNPVNPSPVNGSEIVVSRLGTVSAQNAWSYQSQGIKMPHFATKNSDGLPGLELHRQLGRLIQDVSSPLPLAGAVHSVADSSYLHTSSAFFTDEHLNLNEPFVRAILDFYNSKVVPLDFRSNPIEAQNTVNKWGAAETGGLINHFLVYPPPADTAVIQAVAVHFRGAWQTPFIPEGTIPGEFKTSENATVPVKFMRGSFEDAFYAENRSLGLRLLALPYSKSDCAMYVILPTEDNPLKFNVGHMVTQLTSKILADFVGMAQRRSVNVIFPRLSLTRSLSLAKALEDHAAFLTNQKVQQTADAANTANPIPTSTNTGMPVNPESSNAVYPGLQKVVPLNAPQTAGQVREGPSGNLGTFTRNPNPVPDHGATGDSQGLPAKPGLVLTGAAGDQKFRVSNIIQEIALEINESGTEAAAIAGSTINYSGGVKIFKVNRPFLFFIRHEATNAILFWGTIVDPTA